MKFKNTIVFIALFFLVGYVTMAQPNPGGDPDEAVPITGIEILLLAGGAFGFRKLIKSKKKD